MLGDSININNFNCNPVVLKKKYMEKPPKITILGQLVQKRGHYEPHPKQKTFFTEIIKPYHKVSSKTFSRLKIHKKCTKNKGLQCALTQVLLVKNS